MTTIDERISELEPTQPALDSITTQDELDEFRNDNKYLIVDATATWCGPCQRIKPKILQMSQYYPHIKFTICDIEEEECPIADFVTVLPTFLIYKDGQLEEKIEGADIVSLMNIVKTLDEEIIQELL